MKRVTFWMLLVGLTTSACSNHDKKQDPEVSGVDGVESEADFLVDSESDFLFEEDLVFEEEEEVAESPEEEAPMQEAVSEEDYIVAMEEERAPSETVVNGEMREYVVQEGETLMMIAFHIYGDYAKWKDLQSWNQGISSQNLSSGSVLQYEAPAEEFSWNPDGLPYLVKKGDSLGSISDEKYGTVKRWSDIYENNQPLIKDPDLIFAGFTLYYIPDRDLASEEGRM